MLKLPQISLGSRRRPLIGLDITTSSVKQIELVESGGQYRVEAYAAEPTPHNAVNEKAIVDANAVSEAIRRAVKRSGVRNKECAVAISGDAAASPARASSTSSLSSLASVGSSPGKSAAWVSCWITGQRALSV